MSCLQIQALSFGFSDRLLFSNVNIKIEPGELVGLIGANGTGKTTLFKLITGELTATDGAIVKGKNTKLGQMLQFADYKNSLTVYDEALTVFADVESMENELNLINDRLQSKPGDASLIERQIFLTEEIQRRDGLVYKAITRSALLGLGFSDSDLEKECRFLSGGQLSKLALCKLLLSDSNLILLDEPTNHLDIDSVMWLEDFLSKYKGAAIIISHDRFFLDKATSKTIEICAKKVTMTKYSYSNHKKLMEQKRLTAEREHKKSIKEIERIEAIIKQQKQFNQERNYVTIASKEKQIDRIKSRLGCLEVTASKMQFSFRTANESSNEVLSLNNISKAFGENKLFSGVKLDILKGDRVFIMGPNGCGKSTLLKIIMREIKPDSGFIKLGNSVKTGYFDQNITKLINTNTVLEEAWSQDRRINQTQIRSALASFLFFNDDAYKLVEELSGGERTRLALLKLMLLFPNFLILDEPTNHLDISSREVFEDALLNFEGTILTVSHDRYLINKLASKIAILESDGLKIIEGTYEDYLQYKTKGRQEESIIKQKKNDYKLRKERESEERKRKGEIERLERRISELELEITQAENELCEPEIAVDYQKVFELSDKLTKKKEQLVQLYHNWEKLIS
ncbi:MAG: ABC-F family ATP-binding cassette domain-containing protein [Acutalibacteraceae bacterium]|jgi:ATP-binding cassette subfamily F protein 3